MATGVVSIATRDLGVQLISAALLWLAFGTYLGLISIGVGRLARNPGRVRDDLADPARGFAAFTFPAGADVLGTRLVQEGHQGSGVVLLAAGAVAWLTLSYLVPWLAVLGAGPRPALPAVDGSWFLWVVAAQSVAVLAAILQLRLGTGRTELALLAVLAWSVGVLLYPVVAVLVSARLLQHGITPDQLTPSYWVAMGATAITVVAGTEIVHMTGTPMTDATRGLAAGVSVVFWAFGTWLVPALAAASWWRHRHRCRTPGYDQAIWTMVFPLGMYAVAGQALGSTDRLPLVSVVGDIAVWPALAAWFAACLTLLAAPYRAGRGARRRHHRPGA